MATAEVRVPDIGEFDEVEVVEVLVEAGDQVAVDDSLVTLESDKASMDLPAPVAGRIVRVEVAVGDRVGEGDLIVTYESESNEMSAGDERPAGTETGTEAGTEAGAAVGTVGPRAGSSAPTKVPPGPTKAPSAPTKAPPAPTKAPPATGSPAPGHRGRPPHASPSVRKLARELGVDLALVRGGGRKGRITHDDVKAWVKARLAEPVASASSSVVPQVPVVDFSKFGEVEEVPLSRIRRRSKDNLHRSWLNVPHVTQFDEADITELEAHRKSQSEEAKEAGTRLSILPFIMKAVSFALADFPRLSSSLHPSGESLIYKKYVHLGIAVDTEDGLVVPVVRDVDEKGVLELAQELSQLSERAREGKLRMQDVQGACFSISSLGGIGGTAFTPIVNAPEAAILGVSRSRRQPVWADEGWVPRLVLPMSLSYDHRVVDGAEAVRFTTRLRQILADVERLSS